MTAAYRVRQFLMALSARVPHEEKAAIDPYLTPGLRSLFDGMRANDQRHALNVFYHLKAAGHSERALLQAALLHDVGKSFGGVGLTTRVAVVLLQAIDRRLVLWLARSRGPLWQRALYAHVHHEKVGADLVAAAGAPAEMVRLVREHSNPPFDPLAKALHEADQEN